MREKEYFDTLCNTADGVFIVDAEKRILRWNKGAEEILGYAEADVLNHECYQVISGKLRQDRALCSQNCKIHSNALNGTPQENFDVLIQGKDNKPLWLNVSVLSPADGEEPFLAHILRDVTQEKTKELALEQFLSYLEAHDLAFEGEFRRQTVAEKCRRGQIGSYGQSGRFPVRQGDRSVDLLAEGLSTKSLAQKLSISHFTARNHIQNILVKLDLHSKAQAVSYAFKRGIL